jgi:hypothetical protein
MKSDDQVWYSIARTINLGNYESVKIDVGESRSTADLNPEEAEEVYKDLRKTVNDRLAVFTKKLKTDPKSNG